MAGKPRKPRKQLITKGTVMIHPWLPAKSAAAIRILFETAKERGWVDKGEVLGTWWTLILQAFIDEIEAGRVEMKWDNWKVFPPVEYSRSSSDSSSVQSNMAVSASVHKWLTDHCTDRKAARGISKNRFCAAAVEWFLGLSERQQAARLKVAALPKVDPDSIPLKVVVNLTPPAARAILRQLRGAAYVPGDDLAHEVAGALMEFKA